MSRIIVRSETFQTTLVHGSTGPVLRFSKEKVVLISTRSWRVMYPCVRTQRYDRKPLPFAHALSYLCSAVMMRLRSLSAACRIVLSRSH